MKQQFQQIQSGFQNFAEQQNQATWYSDQHPLLYRPATAPDAEKVRGELRLIDVTYTFTGDEVADENIILAPLHVGEKVIPHLSQIDVEVDWSGAGGTIDVGDDDGSGDDDRYATALAAAAVGRVVFDETHLTAEHVITEECNLIASLSAVGTVAAGGRVRFMVVVARA